MSWLGIPWSEGIKKRACRYLLQRYLGKFLEEKLTLDQLTVDLYNGTGCVTDVRLDVQALNELGEQQGLPLEFVDGFVAEISVNIPWSTILSDASYVEVTGLRLTVQPQQRNETGSSMLESMWNSMSSSIQLAQECLQQDNTATNTQGLEGVELFAQRIDSILSRVKVRFFDTIIRLEHVPLESAVGVALEIRINNLEYSDEAGNDLTNINFDQNQANKGYVISAFATKHFYLEGVTLHTDEFPSKARTFSRSVMTLSRESSPDSKNSDQFSSAPISPSQNMQTPPEKIPLNNFSESNPIIFAKISGHQEIRLKLKQGEGVPGPKVELEVTLGSLTLFLTPRQMHVLLELAHGLASPDIEDVSNVPSKTCTEKPMVNSDFNKIERELLNQINPQQRQRSMDLKNTKGWSTASLDNELSDNEEIFLPMRSSMNNSVTSNATSIEDDSASMCSVSSKSSLSNLPNKVHQNYNKHRQSVDLDPSAETMQFHLRVSSLAVILLHEDILTIGIDGCGLTRASTQLMKSTAEEFFKKLIIFAGGYGNKDFEKASKAFHNVCHQSHIRCLAAPLIMEGSEKTTSSHTITSGSLTLASLEIVECLVDNNNENQGSTSLTELLVFQKDDTVSNSGFTNKTNFRLRFKYCEKAVKHAKVVKYTHPTTEIDIHLEPFQGEFDITLIDRISSLLNPQPICTCNPNIKSQKNLIYQAVESPLTPDYRIDVKVSVSKCKMHLRFPIPDLRPLHDMGRVPWWRKSVRPDYVTLHLTDAKIHTSYESKSANSIKHEIQCQNLLVTYTEADSDIPIEIGKATADDCKNDGSLQNDGEGFNWPRIVLTIFPRHIGGPFEDSSDGELESSIDDSLENTPKHQPSPFSSKRVIHESDTPHSRPSNEGGKEHLDQKEGEELIIPGSRQEMTEFIEEASHFSRIQLEISLPCASIQIPSKHLYELLYNRFNSDLLLWEPSAPKAKYAGYADGNMGIDIASTLLHESNYPKFSMCKSGIQYESDSDSEEDGIFYSTTEKSNYIKQKQNRSIKNGQSKVALTLNINQGLITLHTPVRDSKKNVIPGQQGEIILRAEDATIFSVSHYKADENLSYVCVMVKDILLYHCGLITISSQTPPLKSINSIIPKHCFRTIHRTESGANMSTSFIEKDMLRVAIRIQSAHETHRIKTIRVAVGITNATLKHRMSIPQTSWFSEIMDCLDVIDHPVAGYIPPGILTELHVHLWDCAIDYRPLYLPLRSVITLGSFSISSNIAAQTNTSTLRFIAEDLALFISDKIGKTVDIKRDYVCVIDLGLFELSLRLNEKMCGGAPRVDLRASNNVLHVRTCSDSCRALMQLLTYFANDGDIASNNGSMESITVPSSDDGESLLGDEGMNYLSKSQVARVNSLMEEAMQDTIKGSADNSPEPSPAKHDQVEVFYFPDESSPILNDTTANKNVNINLDHQQIEFDDTDEDFCVLGEEAGVGITPRSGIPEVRMLCQEPIRIVDNHFSVPLGKTDLLKAPKHFPPATLRYTLCEMTLVWHIYGGKDFAESHNLNYNKKHVTIDEGNAVHYSHVQGRSRSVVEGIAYNKSVTNKVHFGSVPNSPSPRLKELQQDWQVLGGPGRRHDILMEFQLNKIRFQHEIYPETTTEASRQILLIKEFEIRDRLSSSHINKFLYQYSSEAQPRQSHANMFTLKAVHSRPDPKLSTQECFLQLGLLPLRLNIDQDSLLFLINYFSELSQSDVKQSQDSSNLQGHNSTSKQGTPTHQPPVMSVNNTIDDSDSKNANVTQHNINEKNLMILLEDELTIKEDNSNIQASNESQSSNQPIYFRRVIFRPQVLVRLDYHGKRVDLSHGPLAGLLMGLAQLSCSELRLKSLTNRQGILGVEKLLTYLLSEWIHDIKKNQLPSLLGGVGPMHSLLQLFQGIRDLFWLPIEQYQKDGRIVRGLQRGANSFTTSTAMAALELTTRLISLIQTTAETTYDIVNYGPSVKLAIKGQKGRRKRYSQPTDIREGVANAYTLVKEGLGETANQLVRVASEEHEHKGVSGAVGGVLRQIPPTVVKPIILATEATNHVLGGMRSQLVPDARREAAQKWRENYDID